MNEVWGIKTSKSLVNVHIVGDAVVGLGVNGSVEQILLPHMELHTRTVVQTDSWVVEHLLYTRVSAQELPVHQKGYA
jgi:hypothetical protein